jgi:transcriptional regulator with XRE-family HTH domain
VSFSERLRATRQLVGLSAHELSLLAGYSSAHVGHIERGRTKKPGLQAAADFASVLGVTVEFLISGTGPAPTKALVAAAVQRARALKAGVAPELADPDADEQTPAEAPAAKRLSSRPPPPPQELADATDAVDETTVRTEPPPAESTPNLPPVRVSERNVRTDTNPDDRGDVLPPSQVEAHPELSIANAQKASERGEVATPEPEGAT